MASLFYYCYVGGKRLETKYIIDDIKQLYNDGDIKTIVEPFCGSCAVSLQCFIKENMNKVKYHVNDIDDKLFSFLQYVKVNGSKQLFDEIKEFWVDKKKTKERFQQLFKEYNKNYTHSKHLFFNKFHYLRSTNGVFPTKRTYSHHPERYIETDKFFKKAKITHKDYMKIFEQYKNDKTAILFLDPPYLDSYNKEYKTYCKNSTDSDGYAIDNTVIFINIMNFIKTCKCKVIMIINDNAITRYLFDGFIKETFEKMYQMWKRKTRHLVITNF